MHPLLRSALAVLASLVATVLTISAVESINLFLYPLPAGFNAADAAAVRAYAQQAPPSSMAVVLFAWMVGTFVGILVASRIDIRLRLVHACIVAAAVMAGAVMSFLDIAHPAWFIALTSVLVPVTAWLGFRVGGTKAEL